MGCSASLSLAFSQHHEAEQRGIEKEGVDYHDAHPHESERNEEMNIQRETVENEKVVAPSAHQCSSDDAERGSLSFSAPKIGWEIKRHSLKCGGNDVGVVKVQQQAAVFKSILTDQERERAAQLRLCTSDTSTGRGASHFEATKQLRGEIEDMRSPCHIRRVGGGFIPIGGGVTCSPTNSRRRSISSGVASATFLLSPRTLGNGSSYRSDRNSLASTLLVDSVNTPRSMHYVPFGQKISGCNNNNIQEIIVPTPSEPSFSHDEYENEERLFGTTILSPNSTSSSDSSTSHPTLIELTLPCLPHMAFDESRSPRISTQTKAADSCNSGTLNGTMLLMLAVKDRFDTSVGSTMLVLEAKDKSDADMIGECSTTDSLPYLDKSSETLPHNQSILARQQQSVRQQPSTLITASPKMLPQPPLQCHQPSVPIATTPHHPRTTHTPPLVVRKDFFLTAKKLLQEAPGDENVRAEREEAQNDSIASGSFTISSSSSVRRLLLQPLTGKTLTGIESKSSNSEQIWEDGDNVDVEQQ